MVAKAVAIPARRSAENSAKYGSSVTDMANMTYRSAWQAAVHAETGASRSCFECSRSISCGMAVPRRLSANDWAAYGA